MISLNRENIDLGGYTICARPNHVANSAHDFVWRAGQRIKESRCFKNTYRTPFGKKLYCLASSCLGYYHCSVPAAALPLPEPHLARRELAANCHEAVARGCAVCGVTTAKAGGSHVPYMTVLSQVAIRYLSTICTHHSTTVSFMPGVYLKLLGAKPCD